MLGTDESPAPITRTGKDLTEAGADEQDGEDCHNPHVFTVRTMGAYTGGGPDLVWYGAAGARTNQRSPHSESLNRSPESLSETTTPATSPTTDNSPASSCLSHLIRYLDDAYGIDPGSQVWTRQVLDVLRTGMHAVKTAAV